MTHFVCDQCGEKLQAPKEQIGGLVVCSKCAAQARVPGWETPVEEADRPRGMALVWLAFVIGPLLAFAGVFQLYDCLMGDPLDWRKLFTGAAAIGYGVVLPVTGTAAGLLEWQAKFKPPVQPGGLPSANRSARLFVGLCLGYGLLAGLVSARPGGTWLAVGAGFGLATGIFGAGFCAVTLDNWTVSRSRRLHACIFISLGSLLFSLLAMQGFWVVLKHF